MSPKILMYAIGVLAIASIACLPSVPVSKALAQESTEDDDNNVAEGQTRVHLADGSLALESGQEEIVSLDTGSDATPVYVVGTAVVEGGMVSIKLTDANGSSLSADGPTQVAIYPKEDPWSNYDGDVKDVMIPIRAGMEQLVFSAPSGAATITFDFDIVQEEAAG
ncbi:hypothetical protein NTE_01227 [Candidatus Nitrososphaera evergladensis SR1]|uniref:Uncharacterized protein n=1 Tax=Candidatus Nitrososphaera evergladensis SR1 TaxID=1459636 RepID=A0A075MQ45_9ARCH|nr:hypothetical protein [Candidatus Nitrososphaera evergladensis]AIF83298.1 hypothetical protein NTE_01227 [Candidatus Nitrososphaera evergladensis SR1]